MADNSKIEWTDATWNVITGCSVESPGCKHCYAMKLAGTRLQHHPSRAGLTRNSSAGPVWTGEVRFNEEWARLPLQWKRPRRIFVCAHSDLFHPAVPDEWIDVVFGIMWACLYGEEREGGHVFQILTKRASRMRQYLSQDRRERWADAAVRYIGVADTDWLRDSITNSKKPHPRVWLGVSAENQKRANERIPDLLATPAAVRWVSFEPLLGEVDATRIETGMGRTDALNGQPYVSANGEGSTDGRQAESIPRLDWVVAGFESGPKSRPGNVRWVRVLRDQCKAAGVHFMFKQHGEWVSGRYDRRKGKMICDRTPAYPEGQIFWTTPDSPEIHLWEEIDHYWTNASARVGKKRAGRFLDGQIYDGYPTSAASPSRPSDGT